MRHRIGVASIIERTTPQHSIAVEGRADATGSELYNLSAGLDRPRRTPTGPGVGSIAGWGSSC